MRTRMFESIGDRPQKLFGPVRTIGTDREAASDQKGSGSTVDESTRRHLITRNELLYKSEFKS